MVTSTFATASLLKLYVKWPPPSSVLQNAHPVRNAELRVGPLLLDTRTRLMGGLALPGYRNSSTTAQSGNASLVTAFAKSLHSETVEGDVGLNQPRFHVTKLPVAQGMIVQVDGDGFWHMTRFLRLNVNDRCSMEHLFVAQLTPLNSRTTTVLSFTLTFKFQLANVIGNCLDYISERGLLFDSHTSLGKLHDHNDGSSSSKRRFCLGEIGFANLRVASAVVLRLGTNLHMSAKSAPNPKSLRSRSSPRPRCIG